MNIWRYFSVDPFINRTYCLLLVKLLRPWPLTSFECTIFASEALQGSVQTALRNVSIYLIIFAMRATSFNLNSCSTAWLPGLYWSNRWNGPFGIVGSICVIGCGSRGRCYKFLLKSRVLTTLRLPRLDWFLASNIQVLLAIHT